MGEWEKRKQDARREFPEIFNLLLETVESAESVKSPSKKLESGNL
jgi:hypothetical protein